MKVSEVMTPDPVTVTPRDTVAAAEEIMSQKDIRQLPVVERGQLVGIITDRDVRSFTGGRLFDEPAQRERMLNTSVGSVMTTNPIFLEPDDDLREAVEMLIEEKVGGLPVVDENQGLVGIITYMDILRIFLEQLEEG